jgi:Flp pilus assembly protein TadD
VIPLDAKDSSTSLSEVSTTLVKAASLNNSNWKIWNNLACIQLMEEPQQLQDARKSLKVALACSPAPPKIIEEAILHTIKRNVSMDELRDQVKAILGNH